MDVRQFQSVMVMSSNAIPGSIAQPGMLVWVLVDVTPHGPRVDCIGLVGVWSDKARAISWCETDLAAGDVSRLKWRRFGEGEQAIVVLVTGSQGKTQEYLLYPEVVDTPYFKRLVEEVAGNDLGQHSAADAD